MKPEIVKDDKVAALIGYQGFVGQHLFTLLSVHGAYKKILLLVDQQVKVDNPKTEVIVSSIEDIMFNRWKIDDLFICYDASFFNSGGKYTIPKSSYRHFPQMIQRAANSQVGQVLLLSNRRADPDALRTINRVRGLIEYLVRKMPFWSTHIFRPSLLIGEDLNQEWGKEVADKMGAKIDQYTGGWLRKNKPIEASLVARAMLEVAQKLHKGVHVYNSEWLQDYAIVTRKTDIQKK